MMDDRDGLRERFERQRQADAAGAPRFAAIVARGRLKTRRRVATVGLWLYGTASAAAIVLLVMVLRGPTGEPAIAWSAPMGIELTTVTWSSPTDFLLNTPDAQAVHGMPRLVRLGDLTPAPPAPRAPATDTND